MSLKLRRNAIAQIAALLKAEKDSSPSALMGIGDFYIELCLLEEHMKIVEPYGKMLSPLMGNANTMITGREVFTLSDGKAMLRRIEYCARVSHASEDKMTDESYDRFLRSVVLQHGDWSVVEHEKVTCEFLVDRGITHEIVRHRLASYTQESTRFVNYKKAGGEAKFIEPIWDDHHNSPTWREAVQLTENAYMKMVAAGVKPQIARSVFPNALASKLVMTMNLRAWRHFFVMRTSAQAHPQMRQVTEPLLAEFQRCIPILYEDITPGGQQADMMRLAR